MHFKQLVSKPTTLALSLADCRSQIHALSSCGDSDLLRYIRAATASLENTYDIRLGTWTYDLVGHCFPKRLPLPPLQSVVSITYFDTNNDEQTLDESAYRVLKGSTGSGYLEAVTCFPVIKCRGDAVTVRFTCGFAVVPEDIRQSIALMAAAYNENREGELVGTISKQLELGVERLMAPYKSGYYI